MCAPVCAHVCGARVSVGAMDACVCLCMCVHVHLLVGDCDLAQGDLALLLVTELNIVLLPSSKQQNIKH